MAIQNKTVTIGDKDYTVTTLPARKALAVKIRILNILSKNIGEIDFKNENKEAVGMQVISAIMGAVDEKTADKIVMELVETATINDGDTVQPLAAIFDDHFAGNLKELYSFLLFVFQTNYPDFLGEGSKAGAFITKAAASLKKQEI